MSNGLLNASGLTTPQVTTDKILLEGEDLKDLLSNASTGEIRITAPHSLGDFYFSITPYMPEGVLPLNGSEVSRTTYSDLYNYVLTIHNELVESGKKFIVTEEEWQNISIENNGYVPYYSYGVSDGMFRLPRMSGYLKATGEVDEAGNYVAEGLPNITGALSPFMGNSTTDYITKTGAFSTSGVSETKAGATGSIYTYRNINFNASLSNPIYGNSEHVTPETNTLFVGVWALVAFTQVGTANLNEIKEILSQCETILGDSLPLLSSRYDNKGLETSSWKIGDGTWLDGRIYTEAYNKLIEKIAEDNSQYLEMKESELLSPIEFPESYLVDTENVKFRLPLMVVNERTIIKEWREGTEWYRIWSDGYLEQGGEFYNNAKVENTISFFIPFKDTNYFVDRIVGIEGSYGATANADRFTIHGLTTASFKAYTGNSVGVNMFRWHAFGYIASLSMPPREEWEIDFNYYFKVSHGVDEGRINIEEKLTEFEETAYTRLNEIVEEISKDYVVHVDKQVGELYFSFDNYCPDGVIPLDGRLVSRATYADLWEWVQEKGLVKDDALITTNDENTVSIFNEDGTVKYCSWYGSGDGELTFRVPKINGYIKASGDNTSVGQYIAEGLPNITGSVSKVVQKSSGTFSGALYKSASSSSVATGSGSSWVEPTIALDASRSSSIYGNSEHVTPETNTLFVGVWGITATRAAVFDLSTIEETLKSSESYLMNNVPLMSSRWDRDGLGNLGWVKADGSWIDGKTYTGAYNYCVEKLVSGHENFIDGQVSVISEENFDKFIVDRINKRFRLPITNGQRTWEEVQDLNNPTWVLYWKLAHEFYVPAQAELQEKLDLIDNLVAKTDINLPTLSSRWDSDFAENIGWVKSEGHWLNGNVYRDAYDLMVSRIGVNDKFIEATEGTELTDENADKFLIDTTAVKFRLPLINGESILVYSYKDSTGYCKLYSDGYLEQSGVVTGLKDWLKAVVNLHKSYKDTTYSISVSGISYTGTSYHAIGNLQNKTVNSFTHYFFNSINVDPSWLTTGYANLPAVSEYNCGNYLFFKLADEVPSTVVNTEQVVADLKQECDDFKAALEEKFNSGAFVTETLVSEDGNSWYRKYSDGWLEQGGNFTCPADSFVRITYLIEFANINYTLTATARNAGGDKIDIKTKNINTTYADIGSFSTNGTFGTDISWYACGY